MKPKNQIRYCRTLRKMAVVLAAAPLFQLSQCQTFAGNVGMNFVNGLPSLLFSTIQGLFLAPIQLLLSGQTLT